MKDEFDIVFSDIDNYQSFEADVVVTQRVVLKTLKRAERLVSFCERKGARLIYDLDDDLLSLAADHSEHAYYQQLRPMVMFLLQQADEVWVSTAALAARLAPISDRITVIQNHLDPRIWRARQPVAAPGPIRLLFMGTMTHQSDFGTLLRPALDQVRARTDREISLTLVGVLPCDAVREGWRAIKPPDQISLSYPAFAHWLQQQGPFDIGLAPLTESVFNGSKSWLKFLEYSGLGLATLASSVGEYPQAIVDGVNGRIAAPSVEAFGEALYSLVSDEAFRLELAGNAARSVADSLAVATHCEPRLDRLRDSRFRGLAVAAQ
ncbi:glycosyltransferase [Xanthobacter sp. DSM 24535]|uniref:glycosyltransferase n=1 Tax=Roseixanthobacter psychrophilus TaxID=3119917 RepID=UPI0037275A2C